VTCATTGTEEELADKNANLVQNRANMTWPKGTPDDAISAEDTSRNVRAPDSVLCRSP
jgi:hypothetical protein